ncbi:Dabb family protein [Azohydromonas australica]|uniref:Dabb family protein n=1 Tax=Azohydromonas australica TaxID=364039 RepID=UPI0004122B92|nr:Dabb family protein [Azohydromonas australica]
MLKHIVLFRRKADVQPQPALEQRLVAQMDALVRQIGFIREWKLSANELDRPICWGYALESAFDDAQSLNDYLFHPAHQALIADLKPYFEWAAVDYTVG